MKSTSAMAFAFLTLVSASALGATRSFSESENRTLRSILQSIAPVTVADSIYCSESHSSDLPHRDPIVFCGVDYTDNSRWLTKFRTKWISSRVKSLLFRHGQCEYVDGRITDVERKPYRCQLLNVHCEASGCSAN